MWQRAGYFSVFRIFRVCLFFAGLVSISGFGAAVQLEIRPQPVVVGERAQMELVSEEGFAELREFPEIDGLEWLDGGSRTSQTSIENLRKSQRFSVSYGFRVKREGKVSIPAMTAHLGNRQVLVPAQTITAVKRRFSVQGRGGERETAELSDLLFLRAQVLSSRKEFYIGEEIPLELRVYSINGLLAEFGYPEFSINDGVDIVFRDYSSENPRNATVTQYRKGSEEIDGRGFVVHSCRAALRPISSGSFGGGVEVPMLIRIPRRGSRQGLHDPFFNSFFSGGFGNYDEHSYTLSASLPELKIKPLPPLPSGTRFLGLVGDWNVSVELPEKEFFTGEPLTLRIKIVGTGSAETLRIPEPEFPGFRQFPPELAPAGKPGYGRESMEVRYVLIPLQPGPHPVELDLATFVPEENRYRRVEFHETLKIAKGDNGAVSVPEATEEDSFVQSAKRPERERANGLLYLKRDSFHVLLPLWRNQLTGIILLLLGGLTFWGGAEIFQRRRERYSRDPAYRRRLAAKKRRRAVLRQIQQASPEEVRKVIIAELVPYLNDYFGLPPGAGTDEIIDHAGDDELAASLRTAEAGAYLPGSGSVPEELRDKALRVLKRLSLWLMSGLLLSVFFGASLSAYASDSPFAAYDQGDFVAAEKAFSARFNSSRPDAFILYNLGNCRYQQGRLTESLAAFELARRLAPRDSDIRENLNHVRRRLMLPELDQSRNPLDLLRYLRDQWRPDEWLFLLFAGLCACMILLALRRQLGRVRFGVSLVTVLLFLLICMGAIFSQYATTYNRNRAIILRRAAKLYSLPAHTAGENDYRLYAGEQVKIEELREDGWVRVRTENSEGWLQKDDLARLWPY